MNAHVRTLVNGVVIRQNKAAPSCRGFEEERPRRPLGCQPVTGCKTSACIRATSMIASAKIPDYRFGGLLGDIEEQLHRDNLRDLGRCYVDVVDLPTWLAYLEKWRKKNVH
jgi:hypothetical protein